MEFINKLTKLAKVANSIVTEAICRKLDSMTARLQEATCQEQPPEEPDPMQQVVESLARCGYSAEEAVNAISAATSAIFKPEPLSHLTNNWRKMHGLPMRRKAQRQRRR